MSDITFNIMKIVVTLVMSIITVFVVPYMKRQIDAMKDEELKQLIKMAVYAAQQTLDIGKEKKAEVLRFVTTWLYEHNIKISSDQLDKLIEAAVYEMKKGAE